jgi:hypothetical protein
MTSRRCFCLFTLILVALVAGGVGALMPAGQADGPLPPDWDVADLLAHLDARGVRLCAEPMVRNGPVSAGVFLSEAPIDRQRLPFLVRLRDQGAAWRGLVLAHRAPAAREATFEWQMQDWGEFALLAGGVVLFGDPGLLERIAQALPVRRAAANVRPIGPARAVGNPEREKDE